MNKLYCPNCGELLQITGIPYCKPLYCKKCNKSHDYDIKLHIKKNVPTMIHGEFVQNSIDK